MNKSMIVGVVLGGAAATAAGTMAGYNYISQGPTSAKVLNISEVNENFTTPREVCEQREITKTRQVKDENQLAGTAIGAVVGGLLGSQIGGGKGKKLATIAGAAAGGYAGKKTQENLQAKDTYTEIQTVCQTIQDKKTRIIGYDVEYQLGDNIDTVRMDHKPAETLPVKDGQLVLTSAAQ